VLDIPVLLTGMSFGALSFEAKIGWPAPTMAHGTCSGEGA